MNDKSDKTTLRLQLSFLVMILLTAIIAILGAHNVSKINTHLSVITEDIQKKLSLITEMRSNARERTLSLQIMLLVNDDFARDEYWMMFNHYGAAFARARIQLIKMSNSVEEKSFLQVQSKLTNTIVPVQLKIAELATENEIEKAKMLMVEKALPMQNDVFIVLDEFHTYYGELLKIKTQNARKSYQDTVIVNWVAGIGATLLALITAIWITKRIHRYQNSLRELNENLVGLVDKKTRKLQLSELKQRQVVENAIDGIATLDENGLVESVNSSMLKIFSLPESKLLGCDLCNLLLLEEHAEVIRLHKDGLTIMECMAGHEIELLFKNGVGNEIPITIGFSKNNFFGNLDYSCFIRDISQQKHINKLKDDFISTVSHELRTPLTSIHGSLGLVIGGVFGGVPEKILNLLSIADSNIKRLISLINDILDIQKIESGEMDFNFKNENLVTVLEQSIEENLGYAERYTVTLKFECGVNRAIVLIDEFRMLQVLSNLISNAIKFSQNGESVVVKVEKIKNVYRVSVTDKGKGISESFQLKLFDKFTQEDSSDTKSKGGTGLGLPIAQMILKNHNSLLEFTTKKNQGAQFYFDLPIV